MGKVAGQVVLVVFAGALAFSQNGTTFSPLNSPQSQVPAQDTSATPVNSNNPAAPSTVPVLPSARTSGAPANGSGPAATPVSASAPANTAPASSAPAVATGNNSNGMSSPANSSGAAQPSSESYARALPDDVDVQVPPNTEMRAVLDTPLSTRTSKAGDRFSATVVDPVRGSNGSVAIPSGTRLNGEVTDASQGKPGKGKPAETPNAASSLKDKGKLSVRFRDAILPTGQTVSLSTSLVSVNSTGAKAMKQPASGNAGIGANGGSTFGGPLRGFAIGKLDGGGYILAIRSKDVDLPAQTGMVIRFDQVSHE